jgi:sulfur carrier protein
MMSLTVNGKPRELEGETPLPDFLKALGVNTRTIAIAVNGEVVPKRQYRAIVLRAGDEVEIVRMVGGGAIGTREA